MKNSVLFLNIATRCFYFPEVLMVLWFVFCVFGKVAEVLTCLFFFNFGGGMFLFMWVWKV